MSHCQLREEKRRQRAAFRTLTVLCDGHDMLLNAFYQRDAQLSAEDRVLS